MQVLVRDDSGDVNMDDGDQSIVPRYNSWFNGDTLFFSFLSLLISHAQAELRYIMNFANLLVPFLALIFAVFGASLFTPYSVLDLSVQIFHQASCAASVIDDGLCVPVHHERSAKWTQEKLSRLVLFGREDRRTDMQRNMFPRQSILLNSCSSNRFHPACFNAAGTHVAKWPKERKS